MVRKIKIVLQLNLLKILNGCLSLNFLKQNTLSESFKDYPAEIKK